MNCGYITIRSRTVDIYWTTEHRCAAERSYNSEIKIYNFPHKYIIWLIIIRKASKRDIVPSRLTVEIRGVRGTRACVLTNKRAWNIPIDRQVSAFCASQPGIGVCKSSNIWLAEAFDLYARPIKYRLNFNAREANICVLCTWMCSRDIGVYDTSKDWHTYSYIREHGHMRVHTYLVDSLHIHLPTYNKLQHNIKLASWYHLRRVDAIRSLVKNDRRNRIVRFRNVVSIISDAINRHVKR